jgi:hypothetical protein
MAFCRVLATDSLDIHGGSRCIHTLIIIIIIIFGYRFTYSLKVIPYDLSRREELQVAGRYEVDQGETDVISTVRLTSRVELNP